MKLSYEENRIEKILSLRKLKVNEWNKKIEEKIRARKEIGEFMKKQQLVITQYVDTFDLQPMDKLKVLTILISSRLKTDELKKRNIMSSIQALKKCKNMFVEKSKHDEFIERAFITGDYRSMVTLWCEKFNNSYDSLNNLFSTLHFFIEKRTIDFIKKYSNTYCIINHIECMYSIQLIIKDTNFSMYKKDLCKFENRVMLRKLLLESKRVFIDFMIYVYRKYFYMLPDVILEQIIDYNYG